MKCSKCNKEAVVKQAYRGAHLCETHLYRSVEKRVKRRIRKESLLEDQERWIVGLSGGKDSSVLLNILGNAFKKDPRVKIIALTLDEGIEGYRNKAVEKAKKLTKKLDVRHEIVEYKEEFGTTIDRAENETEIEGNLCSMCGVLRRNAINKHARRLNATKLLLGHNLDDVAQTALMNFLEGDIQGIGKHYRASLSGNNEKGREEKKNKFINRAKPLRDIPEKEVALYAHLKDLPFHSEECPNAAGKRGEIRNFLLEYERNHPGTRHSIISGYEKIAEKIGNSNVKLNECRNCGEPTTGNICRACSLLA